MSNIKDYYNVQLGNWKMLSEKDLRLKPEITFNKGFFSALAGIHLALPYLDEHYFKNNIKLNILYYSHNYGSYPNFQVIGDLLKLNYEPTINKINKQYDELTCITSLNKHKNKRNSFDNFKVANNYFSKFFKFDNSIYDEVNKFSRKFKNKKVFGVHFRGTDKNKVKWMTHISIDEFIAIVDYQLKQDKYDAIFISTDEMKFIDIMKKLYQNKYAILFYDTDKNNENTDSIHLNRLSLMENKIKELKKNIKSNANQKQIDDLENSIKKESQINRELLKNAIVNTLLLSKCEIVIKTHSQLSAYAKVFNPNLKIFRVNNSDGIDWPEINIPYYDYTKVTDEKVRNILVSKK